VEVDPEPHVATVSAHGPGSDSELAIDFRAALAAPDVRSARRLIADAADAGASPGLLYVQVVRPALIELQDADRGRRARLAAGIGQSIVADLLVRLPGAGAPPPANRRAALLTCGDHGIEAVDGSLATDFLDAAGWSVARLPGDMTDTARGVVRAGNIELAVAVASGPNDTLALAPMCTDLRRLADPPVVILCDFTGRAEPRAALSVLGADAIARDPEDLTREAARRLPGPGRRRWGVRLSRAGEALTLAPTGSLDSTSVQRLSEVALTRAGTYRSLTVDLRDIAEIDPAGVTALMRWPQTAGWAAELTIVADGDIRRRLAGTGVALTVPIVDAQAG
jgi:ABC-type transporter Mla MlaB component